MATSTQLPPTSGMHKHFTIHTVEPEAPRVPLVGHIITDEDMGTLKGAKLQPVSLNKVVKLLTDPHSAMLYDRHLHALKKVIKHYQNGFIMKDLVAVFKVLNVCADRIEDQSLYIEPMIEILRICCLPFLKEKSSDETAYEQIAIESVAQLGYLMRVPCNEVRLQICETLICFYCEPMPTPDVQRHKPNTLSYNQKVVEHSDIAETLIKSLALLENDLDVKQAVLNVLQKLSKYSPVTCNQMLSADAAGRLCSRLMDYDPTGQVLFRSVDILWNLLENGSKQEVASQLNNLSCIGQLQDAFIQQLTQGYSHYDRQLRNDLLIIASLVASQCPSAPFIETQFLKHLTLFATFQEVKSHNALVRHLKLLQNHEDFELKKLFINLLTVCSQEPAAIPILSEGKLLLALFSYVKSNEKVSGPKEWTPAQFEEIQLHAMAALSTLSPLMIEDYMMCQGSTRLLLLLEWCVGPDDYGGSGNSYHAGGGRDNKKAQMRHCLRLMRSMVSTGDHSVLTDMADQGAINQLTTILCNILRSKMASANQIEVEMQTDMLFILSTLCENDMHRKELFGNQGVDVTVEYLKMDAKLLTSGLGHHRLLLAAIDCVWCAIVGCYLTEDYFLEKEGIFLLVDLLESCPKNMHNLVLGCLLDLAENPKAIPHINAWRGKEDVSAAHLFCDIWREEEREMGVRRDVHGAIEDAMKPLMGEIQEAQGIISLPASCPSQAIVDVSENMRAKLYALFCKIGFVELPGLTTEDHVTLTIVEHYLDFKLGEVWTEIIGEFGQDQLRPITPDAEALEAIARTVEDRAEHVLDVQRELLEAQHQQDLIYEQEHYAEIRENHRQKEKAITDFHDFVARTSSYQLLKAAKERQEISIDASRVQTNYKSLDTFHSTDLPDLNTTNEVYEYINAGPNDSYECAEIDHSEASSDSSDNISHIAIDSDYEMSDDSIISMSDDSIDNNTERAQFFIGGGGNSEVNIADDTTYYYNGVDNDDDDDSSSVSSRGESYNGDDDLDSDDSNYEFVNRDFGAAGDARNQIAVEVIQNDTNQQPDILVPVLIRLRQNVDDSNDNDQADLPEGNAGAPEDTNNSNNNNGISDDDSDDNVDNNNKHDTEDNISVDYISSDENATYTLFDEASNDEYFESIDIRNEEFADADLTMECEENFTDEIVDTDTMESDEHNNSGFDNEENERSLLERESRQMNDRRSRIPTLMRCSPSPQGREQVNQRKTLSGTKYDHNKLAGTKDVQAPKQIGTASVHQQPSLTKPCSEKSKLGQRSSSASSPRKQLNKVSSEKSRPGLCTQPQVRGRAGYSIVGPRISCWRKSTKKAPSIMPSTKPAKTVITKKASGVASTRIPSPVANKKSSSLGPTVRVPSMVSTKKSSSLASTTRIPSPVSTKKSSSLAARSIIPSPVSTKKSSSLASTNRKSSSLAASTRIPSPVSIKRSSGLTSTSTKQSANPVSRKKSTSLTSTKIPPSKLPTNMPSCPKKPVSTAARHGSPSFLPVKIPTYSASSRKPWKPPGSIYHGKPPSSISHKKPVGTTTTKSQTCSSSTRQYGCIYRGFKKAQRFTAGPTPIPMKYKQDVDTAKIKKEDIPCGYTRGRIIPIASMLTPSQTKSSLRKFAQELTRTMNDSEGNNETSDTSFEEKDTSFERNDTSFETKDTHFERKDTSFERKDTHFERSNRSLFSLKEQLEQRKKGLNKLDIDLLKHIISVRTHAKKNNLDLYETSYPEHTEKLVQLGSGEKYNMVFKELSDTVTKRPTISDLFAEHKKVKLDEAFIKARTPSTADNVDIKLGLGLGYQYSPKKKANQDDSADACDKLELDDTLNKKPGKLDIADDAKLELERAIYRRNSKSDSTNVHIKPEWVANKAVHNKLKLEDINKQKTTKSDIADDHAMSELDNIPNKEADIADVQKKLELVCPLDQKTKSNIADVQSKHEQDDTLNKIASKTDIADDHDKLELKDTCSKKVTIADVAEDHESLNFEDNHYQETMKSDFDEKSKLDAISSKKANKSDAKNKFEFDRPFEQNTGKSHIADIDEQLDLEGTLLQKTATYDIADVHGNILVKKANTSNAMELEHPDDSKLELLHTINVLKEKTSKSNIDADNILKERACKSDAYVHNKLELDHPQLKTTKSDIVAGDSKMTLNMICKRASKSDIVSQDKLESDDPPNKKTGKPNVDEHAEHKFDDTVNEKDSNFDIVADNVLNRKAAKTDIADVHDKLQSDHNNNKTALGFAGHFKKVLNQLLGKKSGKCEIADDHNNCEVDQFIDKKSVTTEILIGHMELELDDIINNKLEDDLNKKVTKTDDENVAVDKLDDINKKTGKSHAKKNTKAAILEDINKKMAILEGIRMKLMKSHYADSDKFESDIDMLNMKASKSGIDIRENHDWDHSIGSKASKSDICCDQNYSDVTRVKIHKSVIAHSDISCVGTAELNTAYVADDGTVFYDFPEEQDDAYMFNCTYTNNKNNNNNQPADSADNKNTTSDNTSDVDKGDDDGVGDDINNNGDKAEAAIKVDSASNTSKGVTITTPRFKDDINTSDDDDDIDDDISDDDSSSDIHLHKERVGEVVQHISGSPNAVKTYLLQEYFHDNDNDDDNNTTNHQHHQHNGDNDASDYDADISEIIDLCVNVELEEVPHHSHNASCSGEACGGAKKDDIPLYTESPRKIPLSADGNLFLERLPLPRCPGQMQLNLGIAEPIQHVYRLKKVKRK